MNIQEKLQAVFREQFQIKRVVKEIETLRQAKPKLGFQMRFSITRNTQISIYIQIIRQKLKQMAKLSFLDKLGFRIILKSTYPTEQPKLYFQNQNTIQMNLNPFYDYLNALMPQWSPKNTCLDIIKVVPAFIIKCNEGKGNILGVAQSGEYFQADKMFSWIGCQTFPLRLIKGGDQINSLLSIVNGIEVVLLQASPIQGSYITSDFIPVKQLAAIHKHKVKQLKAMIEVKKNKIRYGIEFMSEEYQNIMGAIVQAIKSYGLIDKQSQKQGESDSSEQQAPLRDESNGDLQIDQRNIEVLQEQIAILQSLVDSNPTSGNIKQLVDLLKKAVQYYSVHGDNKFNLYLKNLQDIMGNQIMQAMLASDISVTEKFVKKQYQSIVDYV